MLMAYSSEKPGRTYRNTHGIRVGPDHAAVEIQMHVFVDETGHHVLARRVVEETGGNHTAAAKRLGISRTALWRLLKGRES